MEAKCTKGPWAVHRGAANEGQAKNAQIIAQLPLYRDEESPSKANARLIASAPELLEALEMAVGLIRLLHGEEGWQEYQGCLGMRTINRVLADARGEQP